MIWENLIRALIYDIKIAERSFLLLKEISSIHGNLENGIKKDISQILNDISYTEMVLALGRLYDKPNQKYPTRCIKSLYNIPSEENFNPENCFRENVEYAIEQYDILWTREKYLKESDNQEFINKITALCTTEEFNEPLYSSIIQIKIIRDKLLAHNEDKEIDTVIQFDNIEELINHAKNVVSIYALYLCNINLKPANNYYLSHSAHKWAYVYKKFSNPEN